MNKYISYLVATGLLLFAAGCKKIVEVNPGGSTADDAWSTPAGMLTLVNATYVDYRNYYGKEDAVLMSEGGTDLWFNANRANYANQLTRYEGFTSSSSGTSRNSFTTFYRALNLCNAGIERIQKVTYPNMQERNQREAEMRFNRAFHLWHIVMFYGGVHLKLTETQEPIYVATRSNPMEFFKQIMTDLEFAAANLPLTRPLSNEVSRATAKSALGLMARAALDAAYHTSGTEATQYFTKARDAAKQVIDRQTEFSVRLAPNYADIWDPANNKKVGREPNGEALFTITNSLANLTSNYDGNANRMHLWFLTQYSNKIAALTQTQENGNDNQRRLMPTRTLLDYFDESMDSRYRGTFQEVWIANNNYTWTTNDANRYGKVGTIVGTQRRAGIDTIMVITKRSIPNKSSLPYLVFDRDSTYHPNGAIKGSDVFVPLIKFRYPFRTAVNAQPGFNDIFLIRLAEMYMVAAEAELQLGNAVKAAEYINVIRTRAAIKSPVNYTAQMQVTPAQVTLDFILQERAREFAGEHLRWFDLKRIKNQNNFATFIKATNPDIVAVQDYHRLRPVPLEELDALINKSEFGQNPGY
jgi:starch-binding outer membrane protein, SusD/RagB family